MVAHGLTSNVTLSGTVMSSGTSVPFTGTGTYTLAAGVSVTFNGTAASGQTETISGTVTVEGVNEPISTTATDYYATSNSAFLGEQNQSEYDVAQAPFEFPTSVSGGSGGALGTLLRYTDQTMSVSRGTVQVTYQIMAPVDPGSPIGIVLTSKAYDTQNALEETDVTHYTMSSANVISFVSTSAQNSSGTVTATAQ
jgi:hypothetical protein